MANFKLSMLISVMLIKKKHVNQNSKYIDQNKNFTELSIFVNFDIFLQTAAILVVQFHNLLHGSLSSFRAFWLAERPSGRAI